MKKKLALAAPFIITVSGLAACDDPKPEPMPVHGNPPGPDPTTPPTAPTPSVSAAPLAIASAEPKQQPIIHRNPPPAVVFLNPDVDGEPVLKSGGKCTANGKSVACPDSMKSAAWDKCDNGRIRRDNTNATCQCQWSGSNPPAPKDIPCP